MTEVMRNAPADGGAPKSMAAGPDNRSVGPDADIDLQPTLDDALAASGRRARRTGQRFADLNTFDPHRRLVLDEISRRARTGVPFTSDDVVEDAFGSVDANPLGSSGSLGALFTKAANEGTIRAVGFAPSRRASRHGAWIRQWGPGAEVEPTDPGVLEGRVLAVDP